MRAEHFAITACRTGVDHATEMPSAARSTAAAMRFPSARRTHQRCIVSLAQHAALAHLPVLPAAARKAGSIALSKSHAGTLSRRIGSALGFPVERRQSKGAIQLGFVARRHQHMPGIAEKGWSMKP